MGRNAKSFRLDGSWSGKLRKPGAHAKAHPYDPSVSLRDPVFVQEAILQSVREGDYQAVIDIYRAHLRVLNRTTTARALHVSRQYVHKMLKPSNTPSLRTFTSFMKLLGEHAAAR